MAIEMHVFFRRSIGHHRDVQQERAVDWDCRDGPIRFSFSMWIAVCRRLAAEIEGARVKLKARDDNARVRTFLVVGQGCIEDSRRMRRLLCR